jgi:hypothetical protein
VRPAEEQIHPTVSDVVRRAVAVADPGGRDAVLGELERRFEDDDRPISSVDDPPRLFDAARREREASTATGIDGALEVTSAIATYLAFRRDEFEGDREELVRLAVRAGYEGDPPAPVSEWLLEAGIET